MIIIITNQQINTSTFCVIFRNFSNRIFNTHFTSFGVYLKFWINLFNYSINKGFKKSISKAMITIRIQQLTQERRMQPDLTCG